MKFFMFVMSIHLGSSGLWTWENNYCEPGREISQVGVRTVIMAFYTLDASYNVPRTVRQIFEI